MLDIKYIRENLEAVRKNIADRDMSVDLDALITLDDQRKSSQTNLDELRSTLKSSSKSKPTPEKIAELKQLSQQIKELQAIGRVVFLKDKQLATGNKATYYINQDKVIITGNVELKRDGNIIKGEKLIIDFLTGLSKMEASNTNQKVRMKYSTE